MVRHISVPRAKTWLLPKAVSLSLGADTVVVNVGSNYIMKVSSEQLTMDFKVPT